MFHWKRHEFIATVVHVTFNMDTLYNLLVSQILVFSTFLFPYCPGFESLLLLYIFCPSDVMSLC